MSDTSRTLEVVLEFRDKLTGGLKKGLSSIKSFASGVGSAFTWMKQQVFSLQGLLLGIGGALTLRSLGNLISTTAEAGRQLNNLAIKTGLSVETLSALKFAAEESGVDIDTLAKGFVKFEKGLSEFQRGGGEAGSAMSLLGEAFLNAARGGAGLSDLLPLMADGFQKLTNAEDRAWVAQKLFGKGGAELLPILVKGRGGLGDLMREAKELDLTWTKLEADSGEKFTQTLGRFKGALEGIVKTGIMSILPALTEWMERLIGSIVKNKGEVLEFFAGMLDASATALPALESAARSVLSVFETLGKAIAKFRYGKLTNFSPFSPEPADYLKTLEEHLRQGTYPPLFAPAANNEAERHAEMHRQINELRDILGISYEAPGGAGLAGGLSAAAAALRQRAAGKQGGGMWAGLDVSKLGGILGGAAGGEGGAPKHPIYEPKTWKEVKDSIRLMGDTWLDVNKSMIDGFAAIGHSLEDGLVSGLEKAIDRTGSLRDVMVGFMQEVRHELLKIPVKAALGGIVSGLFGASGLFPGVLGGGGVAEPGGGRILPLAGKGMVRTVGPTIAGEAGPEAVVPLPDGRKIPVDLRGGSGGTVLNIYVNTIDAKSFDERFLQGLHRKRGQVADVMAAQYQARPSLRKRYA